MHLRPAAVLALIAVLSLVGVTLALHRYERSYVDWLMSDGRSLYVEEMAEFAVAEYNKQMRKKVVLARTHLLSAREVLLVGGAVKYKFSFAAKDEETLTKSADGRFYEAVVIDMSWINFRSLVSFNRYIPKFPPSTD